MDFFERNIDVFEQYFFERKMAGDEMDDLVFEFRRFANRPSETRGIAPRPVYVMKMEDGRRYPIHLAMELSPRKKGHPDKFFKDRTFLNLRVDTLHSVRSIIEHTCFEVEFNTLESVNLDESCTIKANLVMNTESVIKLFKPIKELIDNYNIDIRIANHSITRILESEYIEPKYTLLTFRHIIRDTEGVI